MKRPSQIKYIIEHIIDVPCKFYWKFPGKTRIPSSTPIPYMYKKGIAAVYMVKALKSFSFHRRRQWKFFFYFCHFLMYTFLFSITSYSVADPSSPRSALISFATSYHPQQKIDLIWVRNTFIYLYISVQSLLIAPQAPGEHTTKNFLAHSHRLSALSSLKFSCLMTPNEIIRLCLCERTALPASMKVHGKCRKIMIIRQQSSSTNKQHYITRVMET